MDVEIEGKMHRFKKNNKAPTPWLTNCIQMCLCTEVQRIILTMGLFPSLINDKPVLSDLTTIQAYYNSNGQEYKQQVKSMTKAIINCLGATGEFKKLINSVMTPKTTTQSMLPALMLLTMCRFMDINELNNTEAATFLTPTVDYYPFKRGFYFGNVKEAPQGVSFREVGVLGHPDGRKKIPPKKLFPIQYLSDVELVNWYPQMDNLARPVSLFALAIGTFLISNPNVGDRMTKTVKNYEILMTTLYKGRWGINTDKYKVSPTPKKQKTPRKAKANKDSPDKKDASSAGKKKAPSTSEKSSTDRKSPPTEAEDSHDDDPFDFLNNATTKTSDVESGGEQDHIEPRAGGGKASDVESGGEQDNIEPSAARGKMKSLEEAQAEANTLIMETLTREALMKTNDTSGVNEDEYGNISTSTEGGVSSTHRLQHEAAAALQTASNEMIATNKKRKEAEVSTTITPQSQPKTKRHATSAKKTSSKSHCITKAVARNAMQRLADKTDVTREVATPVAFSASTSELRDACQDLWTLIHTAKQHYAESLKPPTYSKTIDDFDYSKQYNHSAKVADILSIADDKFEKLMKRFGHHQPRVPPARLRIDIHELQSDFFKNLHPPTLNKRQLLIDASSKNLNAIQVQVVQVARNFGWDNIDRIRKMMRLADLNECAIVIELPNMSKYTKEIEKIIEQFDGKDVQEKLPDNLSINNQGVNYIWNDCLYPFLYNATRNGWKLNTATSGKRVTLIWKLYYEHMEKVLHNDTSESDTG